MRILHLIGVLFLLVALQNCQTFSKLRKPAAPKAAEDSLLFHPGAPVKDAFLDSLSNGIGNSAQLSMVLVPPPAPEPLYKWIDGYRVQVFAGLDSLRALQVRQQAATVVTDTVYVLKEKGMYKVQAGDYLYYPQADSVRKKIRVAGFNGAWVAAHKIRTRIKKDDEQQQKPAEQTKHTQVRSDSLAGSITIQILATGDERKASALTGKLQAAFSYPAYYQKSGKLFKVYLGKFSGREEAESALRKVRAAGYPDAWLVY